VQSGGIRWGPLRLQHAQGGYQTSLRPRQVLSRAEGNNPATWSEGEAQMIGKLAEPRGWETKGIEVPVGAECRFRLVEVTNVDDLLDQLMEKGGEDLQDDRLPYWIEVWPSALVLSEEILSSPLIGPGVSVVEVGCGLGLCSLAAARKGADVIQTDYLKEALDMANLTWHINANMMPPTAKQPRQRILDWRHPDPHMQCDVLLASDVAYEERAFEPLIQTFKVMVKPGGKVLLTEPNRSVARSWTKSLAALSEQGLELTSKTDRNVTHGNHTHTVTLYELTKNEVVKR